MKRFTSPGMVCLSLFGVGLFAAPRPAQAAAQKFAATSPKKPTSGANQLLSGTVLSSTDPTLVIGTKRGRELTFKMDQKKSKPAQLNAGESVRGGYGAEDGSERAPKVTVKSVSVETKSSPKKTT